jgi:hypothetical protein
MVSEKLQQEGHEVMKDVKANGKRIERIRAKACRAGQSSSLPTGAVRPATGWSDPFNPFDPFNPLSGLKSGEGMPEDCSDRFMPFITSCPSCSGFWKM